MGHDSDDIDHWDIDTACEFYNGIYDTDSYLDEINKNKYNLSDEYIDNIINFIDECCCNDDIKFVKKYQGNVIKTDKYPFKIYGYVERDNIKEIMFDMFYYYIKINDKKFIKIYSSNCGFNMDDREIYTSIRSKT